MKCCVFLLLLGSFFILGHCVFPSGSCDGYTNITESWRNFLFTSKTFHEYPKDDATLIGKWWRFTGIGGDLVIKNCHLGPRAGVTYPIYISSALPTTESETATKPAAYESVASYCTSYSISIDVVLCPGGFYIYNPLTKHHTGAGYATYHNECMPDSCGPLAECSGNGGCVCVAGYEIPSGHLPTPDSYGCADINECLKTENICGSYSNCTNTIGAHECTCWVGFIATDTALPPLGTNPCKDFDECLDDICGAGGTCTNNVGSYVCECHDGYKLVREASPECEDIDECLNITICGPDSICTNTPGAYTCKCKVGYAPTDQAAEPSLTNVCIDVDECDKVPPICGPYANCTNSIGSYYCECFIGFRLNKLAVIASYMNPCTDIDECYENTVGTTFCQTIENILEEIKPPEGQTKEKAFLGNMDQQLKENEGIVLPPATVSNSFSASMEVSGVGPRVLSGRSKRSSRVSSAGDAETGSMILGISERLVTAMVHPGENQTQVNVTSPTVGLSLESIGPQVHDAGSSSLSAKENTMTINLEAMAKNNNGTASAVFFTLNGMESLLSHQNFKTENRTEMYSDVITAILPLVNNTNLTEPVNFTIQHKKTTPENGMMTCVYWEEKTETGGKKTMSWSVDGCWVAYTNENYTVCSCSHLSTFALIMQIGEPAPPDPFLEWLNRMCVIVGLFFFALAIFTFLLCSWNPKINNTARLHLCLCLFFTHLLLLWNDKYVEEELACTVMAGLLHFLVVAGFVWMLLEALQLHLLVRRLSKVQVIQRDGLPRPVLFVIGYGIPFVIVGVSAVIYSDGYGATEAEVCWLSRTRHFNWALTGPVIVILALNWILFLATLWSLRPTLANMKSDVSQSKDTTLILFKIVAQFVILGCTWILGLYQSNIFFQILFIVLNSQQGTFLFIVHCLLNKEVREEYIKWLTCSFNKEKQGGSVRDAPSFSEDFDKAED
ncbi:hypothetical protein PBY51_008038 [Eleginops maclovinus]|uniref:Uncharacterized protein n=1 Tax=Eleginops maclovinus TaxID=56733 RepID=A0AAN7XA81_ELEMC|nr:hypothetical protein PBY51_008038 [Eleginops maclovinus]